MVMRKLVFALLGILFLLSYSSCGEDLTRTVKVYNHIDTTLVLVICDYFTKDIDRSCEWRYPMFRIEPRDFVEYTLVIPYDIKAFDFLICRDLTGDKRDLNTMIDCDLKSKIFNLRKYIYIYDKEMQERGYVLVLDSLILGLKSPE
jgi:hypothetical protein